MIELQILDVDYVLVDEKPVIRIFGKTEDGKTVCGFYDQFSPYFYIEDKKAIDALKGDPNIMGVSEAQRKFIGNDNKTYKVTTKNPAKTPEIRERLRSLGFTSYEADILFRYRFLNDLGLGGLCWIKADETEVNTGTVKTERKVKLTNIQKIDKLADAPLKMAAIDIECISDTSPLPEPKRDPIILISFAFSHDYKGQKDLVLGWRPGANLKAAESEKEMLEDFVNTINEYDPDIITGYNCFPGDEEIILGNGKVIELGSYVKNGIKNNVIGFNNRVKPYAVYKTWSYEKGPHIVLRIKTKTGREIRTTLDNKILLGGEEVSWLEARKLKGGDLIAVPRVINIEEESKAFIDFIKDCRWVTDKVYLTGLINKLKKRHGKPYNAEYERGLKTQFRGWMASIVDELGINANTFRAEVSSKRMRMSLVKKLVNLLDADWETEKLKIKEIEGRKLPVLSKELFYILGLVATDGSVEKGEGSNKFRFYNTDKRLVRCFTKIVEGIIKKPLAITKIVHKNPKHSNIFTVHVTNALLRDFVLAMGLPAGNRKKIPYRLKNMIQFPKEFVGAFLAGYYDGDGYKNGAGLLTSGKDQIKKDLQLLFTRIGVVSTVNVSGTRPIKSRLNNLNIDKYVNPYIKTRKIKVIPKRYCHDILPVKFNSVFKELRLKHGFRLKDFSMPYSVVAYLDEKRQKFSVEQWESALQDFEKAGANVSNARKLLDYDLYWDKIESIEPEFVDSVYDLTTQCSNFVVNNVLAHNCNNFDFPYILERMRQLGVKPAFSRCETKNVYDKKVGINTRTTITGRIVVDSFAIVKKDFSLVRYGLDFVGQKLLGEKKVDIKKSEIGKMWKGPKEDFDKLVHYSRIDSVLALNLVQKLKLLNKYTALSKVAGTLLQDTLDSGETMKIENFLLREFNGGGYIFPNKPNDVEVVERDAKSKVELKGGFVLEPEKGLHSDIVVLDFKCFIGSTPVITDKGLVPIKEIVEKSMDVKIYSYDKGRFIKSSIVNYFKYGVPAGTELMKIQAANGSVLTVTPNHMFFVYDPVGEAVKEVAAKDLTVNHLLIEPNRLPEGENPIEVITEKKAKFLGYLMSEGYAIRRWIPHLNHVTVASQILLTFSKNEEEIVNDCVESIKSEYLYNPAIYSRGGSTNIRITDKDVYNDISEFTVKTKSGHSESTNCYTQRINEKLYSSSEAAETAFLRAYFTGDGTVNKVRNEVVLTSCNEYMLKDIKFMLLKYGVTARINKVKTWFTKKGEKVYTQVYCLTVCGKENLHKYAEKIGFVGEKQIKLLEAIKNLKYQQKFNRKDWFNLIKIRKVETVKLEHDDYVYDLQADNDSHSFLADFILVHNSMYPSIIISFNMCPTTLVRDRTNLDMNKVFETPAKACFYKQEVRQGIIPKILAELMDRRDKAKKRYKGAANEMEKNILYAEQWALKILANSFYGYFGYARARMYDLAIANSVTACGRETIHLTKDKIEGMGYKVVYGDSVDYQRRVVLKNPENKIQAIKIGEFVDSICDRRRELAGWEALCFEDGKSQFRPIIRAIKHEYSWEKKGRLLRIKTGSGETVVTPQHSVFLYKNCKPEIIEAYNLKIGEQLTVVTKIPGANGINLEGFQSNYGSAGTTQMLDTKSDITGSGILSIDEILPTSHYVYDLEIAGGHSFVDADGGILLHNTDSVMVHINEPDLEKVKSVAIDISAKITDELPGIIELQFEKVFRRFLPLSKKRYVAWKFEPTGNGWEEKIEMKGVETVRRDWCALVSETMKGVIDIILKENDSKKALAYFKGVVEQVMQNKVDPNKLVITKSITRKLSSYAGVQPHVELAKKILKRGQAAGIGDRIGYVIIKGNDILSKRVEDPAYVAEHGLEIDSKYYIENQLLPPIERIFFALGITKSELTGSGKQVGLFDVFKKMAASGNSGVNEKKQLSELHASLFTGFVCKTCNRKVERPSLTGFCECGGHLLFNSEQGAAEQLVMN